MKNKKIKEQNNQNNKNNKEKTARKKTKVSKKSKTIIILQLVFILGIFFFVYFFAPQLKYPKNNAILDKKDISFEFRNANVILIDTNEDFSSPKEVDFNSLNITNILFEPGVYYWRAIGILKSPIRKFTINSNVGLELNEENFTLKNTGDVKLNISKKSSSGVSGLVILDVNVEYPIEIEANTTYHGGQYGN